MKKIILLGMLLLNIMAYSKDIKVTFINPAVKGNIFWDKVVDYMEISAKKLDIDLKILYPSDNHRLKVKKLAFEEINSRKKPDYFLYQYSSHTGQEILKEAEKKQIKSFIFNSDIVAEEKEDVKSVNEKYKYWIGHVYPNDFNAGYRLGVSLIEEARKNNMQADDGKIHIIGLSGSYDSSVAVDRNNGLKKAVKENSDVVLNQVFFTHWEEQNAYTQTLNTFKRYPKTRVIWSASDSIALGAIRAIEKLNKTPGSDVLLGGIDWSEDGLEAIENGKMFCSIGGHFLEGVISLLLIKENAEAKSINLSDYPLKTNMEVISKSNIELLRKALSYSEFEKLKIYKFSDYYSNKATKSEGLDLLKLIKTENSN